MQHHATSLVSPDSTAIEHMRSGLSQPFVSHDTIHQLQSNDLVKRKQIEDTINCMIQNEWNFANKQHAWLTLLIKHFTLQLYLGGFRFAYWNSFGSEPNRCCQTTISNIDLCSTSDNYNFFKAHTHTKPKKLVAFGPKVTKCMPTDNIFSRHAVYRNPRASNPKESSLLVRIFLYLIA